MKRLIRWSGRVLVVLVAAFIVLYAGDWAIYKLRGSPTSSVTVNQFMSVPLKGNKIEYDYTGSAEVACAAALFSQSGRSACWRLRSNPNQNTSY
jgi:hypothetical protein